MSNTIESLEIEIIGSSQSAEKALDALEDSLTRIKNAVKGGCGLTAVTNQLTAMNTALGSMNSSSISNLTALAKGLETLSKVGNFKLSSSVAKQITNLGTATKSLDGADFGKLSTLANALTPLSSVGKANLSSTISQLGKLPAAIQPLSTMDMGGLSTKIRDLVSAVEPLANMGKANLSSTLNQIKKLPDAFTALNSVDMGAFATKIRELTNALKPLADEMQKVANGFSAFPAKIQKLLNATNQVPKANAKAGTSYINLAAKIGMAYTAVKRTASTIASWINKSNEYIENLNLFNASMKSYAAEAQKYAETVGELMGIDPGEWMRNQGVFMTLATGFGVVTDRAYVMSQNLTQLGYDLSSFFNITFEDAMQKLQSGISGELEPLRRLGYDLSQARLEAIALSLGIDKAVSSMTQAEKAELRYYAIMTQVTTAQGDMARTLNAPANQLRILQAQVTQAARALGNIFIPALNAVLPYAIAVAQVVRVLASTIASLFDFALPEVDYSGLSEISAGAADVSDAMDDAAGSAKELNKAMLGIDELNVISPDSGSGGGGVGVGGGSGFDFELPTYDFIGDLTESRVGHIVAEMKEWLGLTEEINSWSDFFNTNLGQILILVGEIGAGLLLWKLSKGLMSGLEYLSNLKKAGLDIPLTIAGGSVLTLTGFTIEFTGVADAIKNGLDELNLAEIILGGITGTAGTALLGKGIGAFITKAFADGAVSKALTTAATNLFGAKAVEAMGAGAVSAAGAAIGAGVGAIIAGIPAFVVGIYDAITNEFDWMNAALITGGATAAGAGIGAIVGALGGPLTAALGAWSGLCVGVVTDLIVANWDSICGWGSTAVATIAQFGSDLWSGIVAIWNGAPEWFDTTVIQPVVSFFSEMWTVVSGFFVNLWDDIVTIFASVGDWFNTTVIQPVIGFFTDLWADISSLASECWEAIVVFFTPAFEWFSKLFGSIYQTLSDIFYDIGVIATGCWEIIKACWAAVSSWFNTKIVQPISNFFSTMWANVKTWAVGAWDGIKSAFSIMSSWFNTKIVQPVGKFFTTLWTNVKDRAINAWNGIKSVFSTIGSWFNTKIVQPVGKFFSTLWTGFVNKAKSAWSNVKTVFNNVASFFKNTFQKAWQGVVKVFSTAGQIFTDIKDGILAGFKKIVNGIIRGLNSAIAVPFSGINTALRKIRGINILGLTPFSGLRTISVPSIPYLANGGMVDAGQMFVAREAGPELVGTIGNKTAVANNDQIVDAVAQGVYSAVVSAMRANGGNSTPAVNVYLDGKQITSVVEKRQHERGATIMGKQAYGY